MAAHHNINGEQLKMFMTPREIGEHYQPYEPDWSHLEQKRTERVITREEDAGRGVSRHRLTFSEENDEGADNVQAWNDDGPITEGGRQLHYRIGSMSERQVWAAKRTDARKNMNPAKSALKETGLVQSIKEHGVQKPVQLGTAGSFGREGKKQIVGGHHRLAVAGKLNPDQLVPVTHHYGLEEAQGRYSRTTRKFEGGESAHFGGYD